MVTNDKLPAPTGKGRLTTLWILSGLVGLTSARSSPRETGIELQIAPVSSSVHIPVATLWAHFQGGDVDKGLAELETQAQTMIDDLLWWTTALKTARKA